MGFLSTLLGCKRRTPSSNEAQLPCVGQRGRGRRLEDGTVLHVHVIGAAGGYDLEVKEDRWTAVTKDGRPSVLVTAVVRVRSAGYDLLTPLLS